MSDTILLELRFSNVSSDLGCHNFRIPNLTSYKSQFSDGVCLAPSENWGSFKLFQFEQPEMEVVRFTGIILRILA